MADIALHLVTSSTNNGQPLNQKLCVNVEKSADIRKLNVHFMFTSILIYLHKSVKYQLKCCKVIVWCIGVDPSSLTNITAHKCVD